MEKLCLQLVLVDDYVHIFARLGSWVTSVSPKNMLRHSLEPGIRVLKCCGGVIEQRAMRVRDDETTELFETHHCSCFLLYNMSIDSILFFKRRFRHVKEHEMPQLIPQLIRVEKRLKSRQIKFCLLDKLHSMRKVFMQ
jgi:hypothetical protein